ncbi:hypothetical protein BBP40_001826 [Aspergillus hancockii]|nr:hypothetical protein BBP40_001826 [Aspergillus hancockii]
MVSNAEQRASQSPPRAAADDSHSDGSSPDASVDPSSLPQAIKSRKAEYTTQQSIRIKVGTWNVAAISGTEGDIGKWFVQREGICEQLAGLRVSGLEETPGKGGGDSENESGSESEQVGLYVLGLQEIVDVSSPAEALRPYVDPAPANRWKAAVQNALPSGYQLVAESQLVGLLLLIYASPSVAESVSSVSSTNVGTGLFGYMGNKGAVATRLMLGETTCLIFVNCHLAAGSDKNSLERRNWDASQIMQRAKFDSIDTESALRDEPTESIGKEDFAFWLGDLNYRLEDIPGDDVRRVLARHTENEYDKTHKSVHVVDEEDSEQPPEEQENEAGKSPPPVSDEDVDPQTDPASLQTTISSLLPHDQLRLQQTKQKAFHEGWREGSISFLPTYKYDVGSVAKFDSSEKQRGPSWCDRILYRARQDMLRHEQMVKEAAEARKRDEEMKARGLDKAAADDNVLFDYDPDVDGADSADEYDPTRDEGSEDVSFDSRSDPDEALKLDYYISHQGILSSDHKPLAAGFTLTYESVIPGLKAQVHQEVVRELDKAENESRPSLTIVVDNHGHEASNDRTKDPNALDFGDISFDVPITRYLTVANTSGVPATFSFEKPEQGEGSHSHPSWLDYHIEPPHRDDSEDQASRSPSRECTLHPGELTTIELTAFVRDIELTRLLNEGKLKLEEVLVLRVTNGRDHFIPVYGEWLPTCFGRSLEELTVMPEAGARTLPAVEIARQKDDVGIPLSAPRELFRLTESISELSERAIAEWSMIKGESEGSPPWVREPHGFAWPFEPESWTLTDKEERSPLLASVREALDTNKPFNHVFPPEVSSLQRLEILSETLLVFLRSLKDGIVTTSVWRDLDQQILSREKTKAPPLSWEESQAWVLESLAYSPAHSVSFTFVTFMLARIANEVAPVTSIPPRDSTKSSDQQSSPTTSQSTTPTATAAAFAAAGNLRRRTLTFTSSNVPEPTVNSLAIRRGAVETALAGLFSSALISVDVPAPTKDKERRALEDRKRSIIEPFLKAIGVDNKGPSGGWS